MACSEIWQNAAKNTWVLSLSSYVVHWALPTIIHEHYWVWFKNKTSRLWFILFCNIFACKHLTRCTLSGPNFIYFSCLAFHFVGEVAPQSVWDLEPLPMTLACTAALLGHQRLNTYCAVELETCVAGDWTFFFFFNLEGLFLFWLLQTFTQGSLLAVSEVKSRSVIRRASALFNPYVISSALICSFQKFEIFFSRYDLLPALFHSCGFSVLLVGSLVLSVLPELRFSTCGSRAIRPLLEKWWFEYLIWKWSEYFSCLFG